MKQILYGAAIVSAIAISGLASAQYNPSPVEVHASGLTIRGGVVIPADNNLRDFSKTLLGVGGEYSFTHEFVQGAETYLSIDWFGKTASGGKGNIFPVCINERFYTGKSRYGKGGRAYFFVGVGTTFIDITASTNARSLAFFGPRGG